MKIHLLFACIISYLVSSVDSQCNVCLSPASVACVSETEFQPCFSDGSKGSITSCPFGTVCTANPSVCVASTGSNTACIPACGNCGTDVPIACLNTTHFAYCFSQTTPSNVIGICPSGMVCSNSAPQFCVNPLVTPADCQETTVAPTTWNSLCSGPGNFPMPGITDCKQYIHCFYSYNVLRVQIYSCVGNTIFYPAAQLCLVPSAAFNCGGQY